MAIEKIKILEAFLEVPAKQHYLIQDIYQESGPIQYCLAGTFKMAPKFNMKHLVCCAKKSN